MSFFNSHLFQIFLHPIWTLLNLAVHDKTFGRGQLPKNEFELQLEEDNKFKGEYLLQYEKGALRQGIYYQTWFDSNSFQSPKGDVVFIHGYGDSGSRFSKHVHHYLERGLRVHAIDLPGHGRSDGIHASLPTMTLILEAIDTVIDDILQKYSIDKVILSGGSLGGLVSSHYAIQHPQKLSGLALVCPAVDISESVQPSQFVILLGKFVNYLIPNLIALPRITGLVSADPQVEVQWNEDPITYKHGVRITTGLTIKAATEYLILNFNKITTPTLIQIGKLDRVVRWQACQNMHEQISSTDKNIIYYDCEHDMFHNESAPKVFDDCTNWMLEYCQ